MLKSFWGNKRVVNVGEWSRNIVINYLILVIPDFEVLGTHLFNKGGLQSHLR